MPPSASGHGGATIRLFPPRKGKTDLAGVALGSAAELLDVLKGTPDAGEAFERFANKFVAASPHKEMLALTNPTVHNICASVFFNVTQLGSFPDGPVSPEMLIQKLVAAGLKASRSAGRPGKEVFFRAVKVMKHSPNKGFGAMTLSCSRQPGRILRGRIMGCDSADKMERFFNEVARVFQISPATDAGYVITNGVLGITGTPLAEDASKLPGKMLNKSITVPATETTTGGVISGSYNIGTVMTYSIARPSLPPFPPPR